MSEPDPHRTTLDAGDRLPPGADGRGRSRGGTGRGGRWRVVALVILACLLVGGVVADHIDLDEYVLTPGHAQPVGPLVKVPEARAHRIMGNVLLTDVYITQVTALSYLYDKFRSDAQILPAVTVLGPATPPSQLAAQGYLEMAQSQQAAKSAALARLGDSVHARDAGTLVFAVVPGSPASRVLRVGQIVTSVDGTPTPDVCAFSRALSLRRAGERVELAVEHSRVTSHAVVDPGPTVHEHVTLARWPSSVTRPASTSCRGENAGTEGYLGVEAETQVAYRFPFPISVRTTSIGGPSAGLAMTLGIIDSLSGGRLSGGHTVAATGTISPNGAVGAVGGVPEKTVAVERAGATVFFVPATQVGTAREKASSSLTVYGVRSLDQVLDDLRRLGGSVPPAPDHGS